MNLPQRKLFTIFCAGSGTIALILLAAGIARIRFHDSLPLPGVRPSQIPSGNLLIPGLEQFLILLLWVTVILLPLAILFLMLSPQGRKYLSAQALQLGLLAIVLAIVGRTLVLQAPELMKELTAEVMNGRTVGTNALPVPPETSPVWLSWALSLAVAALVIWLGFRAWKHWKNNIPRPTIAKDLAVSASQALADLRQGKALKETILRCYQQMVEIAAIERALPKPEYLTASEFIQVLERAGLPSQSVEQLTHLFEFARYSAHLPSEEQNRQAVTCLEAIVQACRTTA